MAAQAHDCRDQGETIFVRFSETNVETMSVFQNPTSDGMMRRYYEPTTCPR